ncbi:MAG: hypothetical protein KDD68_19290 [Bdellovibrionales bacterium]|nr:hypothetical protein [Bdellovibrionales bacterium]
MNRRKFIKYTLASGMAPLIGGAWFRSLDPLDATGPNKIVEDKFVLSLVTVNLEDPFWKEMGISSRLEYPLNGSVQAYGRAVKGKCLVAYDRGDLLPQIPKFILDRQVVPVYLPSPEDWERIQAVNDRFHGFEFIKPDIIGETMPSVARHLLETWPLFAAMVGRDPSVRQANQYSDRLDLDILKSSDYVPLVTLFSLADLKATDRAKAKGIRKVLSGDLWS